MAKEKKVETKAKKIVNLVIMIVEILIIIAGIAFSIVMITGQKTTPTEGLGNGTNITAVLSDSMDSDKEIFNDYKISSFKIGDVLLIKNIKGDQEAIANIQVGDVITYLGVGPSGEYGLISHRVYKIETQTLADGEVMTFYKTLGDKQYVGDESVDLFNSDSVVSNRIQGIVTTKISKIGTAIIWLQDSKHFLFAVVLPLALLLVYNAYLLIRMIMEYKLKKVKEENELAVAAIKADNSIDEEEIKRKAIEEYLAAQKASQDNNDLKEEMQGTPSQDGEDK